jgi:hypothetical protein
VWIIFSNCSVEVIIEMVRSNVSVKCAKTVVNPEFVSHLLTTVSEFYQHDMCLIHKHLLY